MNRSTTVKKLTVAIITGGGVEVEPPPSGLGRVAGLPGGAALGLAARVRKCSRHSCWVLIIHRNYSRSINLTVRINHFRPSPAVLRAPSRRGRVAHSGRRDGSSHHGAPTVSAQRERPGARKGAAERPDEVDGEMRLHTDRSRRALLPSAGQGSPLPPLVHRTVSFRIRIPLQWVQG